MKSQIVIREAKPTMEEGIVFARLFDETSEGFFKSTLGKQAYEIIARAYVKPGNSYSYKNVSFVESESEIIGMVSGYSYSDKGNFNSRILKESSQGNTLKIGIFSIIERFMSRRLGPLGEGDFYIQAIVVSGKMRGKGIGRSLMRHIEDIAKERRSSTLSLDVSSKNEKAISLYEKSGLGVDSFWPDKPLLPRVFTRMTKTL